MKRINKGNLKVDSRLLEFLNNEALPETGINTDNFWSKFDEAVHQLASINKKLIKIREETQKKIDEWHISKKGIQINKNEYIKFLKSINYIVEEKEDFKIGTTNVDQEISSITGPQLVVPVDNARYVLNAANARWRSLYDALYGTDVISEDKDVNKGKGYNPERGNKVIGYVRNLLDKISPLENGTWKEISKIKIEGNNLVLVVKNKNQTLKNKNQFIGFGGEKENPKSILIKNNGLHLDIIIDANSMIGKEDEANISDVVIESAISTIVDHEDSVAAVDAEDKVKGYRNWLGIMKGTLQTKMEKNGKQFIRKLNADRIYTGTDGSDIKLHGRALLLNRNVGHL
ncbi:uncharacterized protein METZ01_LOCUS307142, partial [marine metagenome]